MNHYPRHVGDYIRDTVGLTMLEDGAYTRLLDQYYAREAPLPSDKAMLYRIARATSKLERSAVDSVLAQFFIAGTDGWHQKRCDEEMAAYRTKAAKASASAAIGWAKRKPDAIPTQPTANADAYANASTNASTNAMQTHSVGNANQNQNHNQGVKPELCTHQHGSVESKPSGEKSPLNGQSKPKPGWHRSEQGIIEAGRTLGIAANPGETTQAYKSRLFDAIRGH